MFGYVSHRSSRFSQGTKNRKCISKGMNYFNFTDFLKFEMIELNPVLSGGFRLCSSSRLKNETDMHFLTKISEGKS